MKLVCRGAAVVSAVTAAHGDSATVDSRHVQQALATHIPQTGPSGADVKPLRSRGVARRVALGRAKEVAHAWLGPFRQSGRIEPHRVEVPQSKANCVACHGLNTVGHCGLALEPVTGLLNLGAVAAAGGESECEQFESGAGTLIVDSFRNGFQGMTSVDAYVGPPQGAPIAARCAAAAAVPGLPSSIEARSKLDCTHS